MSTLNTVNITNGTDSITVEGAVKGSAKAWVNFNGTGTVAIRASYNVSSITDNGTGDYTVNFTTAFPDANYSYAGGDSNWGIVYIYNVQTTTACRHQFTNGAGALGDRPTGCLNYFR
jgi:hypothetical protein